MAVRTDTIIRTIVLVLALINQVLSATGHKLIPIDDDQIEELITLSITIIASLVAWWKNNSFTASAIKADAYKKELDDMED